MTLEQPSSVDNDHALVAIERTPHDCTATTMLREQYRSLTALVPYLYIVVIITTLLLTYSTRNTAPIKATLIFPLPLLLVVSSRLHYWWKARRYVDQRDVRTIRRDILSTRILGPS